MIIVIILHCDNVIIWMFFHCDNITKGFDAEFSLFRAVMRARTKAPGIRGSMDPYHFFGLWQQASNTPGACRRGLSSTPEFPLRKEPAVNRNSKIVASRKNMGVDILPSVTITKSATKVITHADDTTD